MPEITLTTYLTVCPLIFFAGLVDSIAGGGGLISLPAFMMAGIPVHFAQGTNKMTSTFGMMIAARQYGKSGLIRIKPALVAAAGSLIGGTLGARLLLLLSNEIAKLVLMICLPFVAVFLLTRKSMKNDTENIVEPKKEYKRGFIVGLGCGLYAGFFGAGGGSFLIMFMTMALGYSMLTASANAKIVNIACDVGALVTYAVSGTVIFKLGVPCIICSCVGNYIGSKLAIKFGSKFIRPVMVMVITLLFVKIALDFTMSI